jgi:hypothetical protein
LVGGDNQQITSRLKLEQGLHGVRVVGKLFDGERRHGLTSVCPLDIQDAVPF